LLLTYIAGTVQRREQLSYDGDANDDDDYDDDDNIQSVMSSSSIPIELRALLARERTRRRNAEDWATFLVATLDSYVRASHAYDRRLVESGPNNGVQAIRRQFQSQCRQITNSRVARKPIIMILLLNFINLSCRDS